MYIYRLDIKNYRNYNDFSINFNEGLNVIIGSNNSGKTGLLHALNLLTSPNDISINDFNKNNLLKYANLYAETPPEIFIKYYINHKIVEEDTSDESIIKLLPFIDIKDDTSNIIKNNDNIEYNIYAQINALFSLDVKYINDYKEEFKTIKCFDEYLIMLNRFVKEYYGWSYTNGISDTKIEQKNATNIFDIRLIEAERTNEEVKKETKREIENYVKNFQNTRDIDEFMTKVSSDLKDVLKSTIGELSELFEKEDNDIGLKKGNVSIFSDIKPKFSIPDSYIINIKDTKQGFVLPLQYNGLGYNNLINIYMLIKLTEIKKGRDFNILCLEEPEAHLHPAMQYKLFKYIKNLDKQNKLNQQIFVTTHSSNISAVAGIDNMFMLSYDKNSEIPDCHQQCLKEQFKDEDKDNSSVKQTAKLHLTKFLDVTRSDMLFADKVILVEGIAEKLLMPLFMDSCDCSYEDEHISIVEIGGKHFEYFIELFNKNEVNKKVLVITDNDFNWLNEQNHFNPIELYSPNNALHIKKLHERFTIDNLKICTQYINGRTFEDELFLTNFKNGDVASILFKKVLPDTLHKFFDIHAFDFQKWIDNQNDIDKRSKPVIDRYITAFSDIINKKNKHIEAYKELVFAELFLHYAKNQKGDLALSILTDSTLYNDDETTKIIVPKYIEEGLRWIKQ